LFTELIYKPIEEITEAAEHISDGDYSIKIYKKGKSHIARLASAFNTMSSNLNDTIRNLTQRKTELEAILGSMAGGVIALNDNDEILFFNKSFISIMALEDKKESMKGSSIYSVVRNIIIYNAMDKVRNKNKKIKLEGAGTKKNQTISITGTPLVAGSRELFGVLLIVEDITQIKKLENVRTDFVSNVTHELKTPLTSIKGFIETLRYGKVEEKEVANKFLDIIDIEVERLSRLIEDILLLSEIESRDERETVLCDINKVATDVLELLEHKTIDNDKVKIVYEAPSYIRPFSANPDRIKELFINLIDNAIKYTEEGIINLVCKEKDDNLFIIVNDSGIGIPKKDLPRIFERFYRVEKGRSRKMGGTGLGLSIVKHIVQLYDGNIEVKSSVGKGTEFKIVLPYKR
ncbi:MAG TPA: GHKL domain-containing protein, partial [Clostridiales bacterium]|nr:GHKL domain-containing protein [Clostridiales bacterium]